MNSKNNLKQTKATKDAGRCAQKWTHTKDAVTGIQIDYLLSVTNGEAFLYVSLLYLWSKFVFLLSGYVQ